MDQGRVLVIDDELGIRMGCQRALTSRGYGVDTAAGGQEGLDKLQEGGFDLVLLDIMMPGISGMETLSRIGELDSHLVCIVITGYATVELAVQAIKQGAYDFITKPFDSDTLLLTVDQGMEKHRLSLQAERLAALEEQAQELEREKADLERLDKMKSSFTLMVAHELRAPVAAIQSYLRLILDGYIQPDQQRTYLERAERRALAQLDLITDLLDLAHLQDPDVETQQEEVALGQVLSDIVESMAGRATEKGIQVECSVAANISRVWCSPQHAKQLWTNLVSNAIKYTPDGGQVSISLDQQGGTVIGRVSDTGIGIAADELALVFEEFYRSKEAKALTQMGTGLGLAIVKRILDTYGGTINVESTVGQGSTFSFTFPALQRK